MEISKIESELKYSEKDEKICKTRNKQKRQGEKILNNSYNDVEYTTQHNQPIAVSPIISNQYEEATTEDPYDLLTKRSLNDLIFNLYLESEIYNKYHNNYKKIDKEDISPIWFYFKNKLLELGGYNIVEIICGVAEFFEFNYIVLYENVISVEDKIVLLSTLENVYSYKSKFLKSKKLF
jgi:hypothetical protein